MSKQYKGVDYVNTHKNCEDWLVSIYDKELKENNKKQPTFKYIKLGNTNTIKKTKAEGINKED